MISQICSAIGAGAAVLTLSIVSGPGAVPVAADVATVRTPHAAKVVTARPATATRSAAASGVPSATSVSVLPFSGSYMGSDAHHRSVRFVMSNGRITHFTVNATPFPNAMLMGHQWHHTCASNLCTRGAWTTDTLVEGVWNDSAQGGDVHFTAALFAH